MSEMPEIQKNNASKTGTGAPANQAASSMPSLGANNETAAKPATPVVTPSVAPTAQPVPLPTPSNSTDGKMQGEGGMQKTTNEGVVAGGTIAADSAKSADVKFTTQNIGAWKSKQEDPFAKQNQEVAEKKAKRAETRKKLQPYVKWGAIGLGAAAVIAVVVVVLVNLLKQPEYNGPTISGDSSEDVIDFRGKLQEIYDETDDLDKVNEAVDELLGTSEGKKYKSQIKLAQAGVFYDQNRALEANQLLNEINPDTLEKPVQVIYYRLRSAASQKINDGNANEYFNKAYEIMSEIEQEQQKEYNAE